MPIPEITHTGRRPLYETSKNWIQGAGTLYELARFKGFWISRISLQPDPEALAPGRGVTPSVPRTLGTGDTSCNEMLLPGLLVILPGLHEKNNFPL